MLPLVAYLISDPGRLLLPVSVVLNVPPLDLKGVGGRARSAKGAGHLYILTALRRDVMRHLCEESWRRERNKVEKMDGIYIHRNLCRFFVNSAKWQDFTFFFSMRHIEVKHVSSHGL